MDIHVQKRSKGRPALPNEKRLTHTLGIRITEAEYLMITEKALSLGFKPSWFLRQILLQGSESVRARPSKAYLETASRISLIASGLTRLLHLAERRSPLPSEIVSMLDSVHAATREVALELRNGAT